MFYEEDEEFSALQVCLADYFKEHPNAADTAEGIFKWWLGRQAFHCSQHKVECVLERLVETGDVLKTINQFGETIYASGHYKH